MNEDLELYDSWTIYDHDKSVSSYEKSIRKLGIFKSVGQLNYFKELLRPSLYFYNKDVGKPYLSLNNGTSREVSAISIFKNEIEPKWEDPLNKNGGEFSIRKFIKTSKDSLEVMDEFWNSLLLFVLSGSSKVSESITGIRVVDSSIPGRPLYRIEIWFSKVSEDAKQVLQTEFKDLFKIPVHDIFFKAHN
jgi:translation initiation factor 4E